MPTMRFGAPAPDATQQVVTETRWGGGQQPRSAWRDTFLYAAGVTTTDFPATWRTFVGPATESATLDTTAERIRALDHPESGIRTNGFNAVAFWNGSSGSTGWAEDIEAVGGKPTWLIQGLVDDVDTEWLALNDATAAASDIDAVLTTPLSLYAAHPSVIGYSLSDDLTNTAEVGRRAEELMERIPQLDAYGRPATPSFLGNLSRAEVDADVWQVGLFGAGSYPVRWVSTGVKRAEGDFTHADDGGGELADWQRAMVLEMPATASVWWWAQAHKLGTGSTPTLDLAYPTAAEIRKQVWELIGSGVRGILWFVYQDDTETLHWLGLAHPDSAERMAAVREMGTRLTPNIRRRLMTARPTADNDEFTTTGGGSSGWLHQNYASAYVSTLYDAVADTHYVVVCNRSATTQSVTIDSATIAGTLVNLETGASIAIGGDVSLPAFDGAIFRVVSVSAFGVPDHMLVQADDDAHGAESWWAQHWMNPASANYRAAGTIATHPNRVIVPDGTDLQAAIDAAPDNTTFVLEAGGTYCLVDLVGRNGMHFICDDPDSDDPDLETNWPILYGLNILGHERAREYHWTDGWVAALIEPERDGDFDAPLQDLDAIAAFVDPPRDYLFRHIHFTQEPGTMVDQYYTTREPIDPSRHLLNPKHAPFYASGVRDILCEYCKWEGFEHSDGNGVQGGTAPMEFTHHGFIYASGGVEGIWIRNCKIDVNQSVSTTPWAFIFYYDGPQNCCAYDNNIVGGASGGNIVTLTNWDVRNDYDQSGSNMDLREWRQPRFVFFINNRFPQARMMWTNRNARKCMAAENLWTFVGLRHCFMEYEVEAVSGASIGVVLRDNDCIGDDVGDSSGSGFCHMKLNGSNLSSGLVITGNFVSGAVPNGYLTAELDSGGLPASYTILGNTP